MPDRRAKRGYRQPHIDVVTYDGHYLHLTPLALDLMLEKKLKLMFSRSGGWLTVGIDPILVKGRREASLPFHGTERRSYF